MSASSIMMGIVLLGLVVGYIGTVANDAVIGDLTKKVINQSGHHERYYSTRTQDIIEEYQQSIQESIPSLLDPSVLFGSERFFCFLFLLFKHKDIFNSQWRPWCFIL